MFPKSTLTSLAAALATLACAASADPSPHLPARAHAGVPAVINSG